MITITIAGGLLRTPEATIADCWDDRAAGLLSRTAGLALMPYLNARERGDMLVFRLIVDGDDAVIGTEVRRDQDALTVVDGQRTGRLYVTTATELLRRLGGA